MSTQSPPVPKSKPSYKAPRVALGDIVCWFPHVRSDDASAAIVSYVGTETIAVAIVHPSAHNFRPKDGVRHKSDPKAETQGNLDAGVWDFREKGDG